MDFRIADTFTESLARLTGEEQTALKTTAFDLQINPASPGMNFHKLAKSRDKGFWSVRVNQDVRLIVHRTERSLLLCYVDHHDRAYAWAERRKLETHPATGAAQLVEIRERVQEIVVPAFVPEPAPVAPKKALFAALPDAQLLAYGVPPEWLADVRQATEDTVLGLADHLPAEAAEALLELATGGTPRSRRPPCCRWTPSSIRTPGAASGWSPAWRSLRGRWRVSMGAVDRVPAPARIISNRIATSWPSATISSGVQADLVFPLNAALSGHLAATVIEVLLIHAAYRVVSLEIAQPDGWDAERVRRVLEHYACALLRPEDSMSPRVPRGAPR